MHNYQTWLKCRDERENVLNVAVAFQLYMTDVSIKYELPKYPPSCIHILKTSRDQSWNDGYSHPFSHSQVRPDFQLIPDNNIVFN